MLFLSISRNVTRAFCTRSDCKHCCGDFACRLILPKDGCETIINLNLKSFTRAIGGANVNVQSTYAFIVAHMLHSDVIVGLTAAEF